MLNLSQSFQQFFNAEKSSGFVLVLATLLALLVVNLTTGATYHAIWHHQWLGLSLEHWVNDGFMAVFFLLIGLELERELYNGELSSFSNALLPLIAAVGGMAMPALLYWALNHGTAYQSGIGIPMATDIAFALGVLSMLGQRVPPALKVFLVAFAVIDDLGAALMIALFYTASISMPYLLAALSVWIFLVILNRLRVMHMLPYLMGGALMWWLTLQSGVHATLAGIALAFAIPFSARQDDTASPSHRLEHILHKPVAFLILPLFAFANTGVLLSVNTLQIFLHQDYSLGILAGLLIGKPLGVFVATLLAVWIGLVRLPEDVRWSHIAGAGMLGGIGFTMSIFVTNLAFADQTTVINTAKIAILGGSLMAGLTGGFWLRKNLDH